MYLNQAHRKEKKSGLGGGEATFHQKISATLVGRLKSLNHIKYQQKKKKKKKINIVEVGKLSVGF